METNLKINITDLQLRNLAEHIPPEKFVDLGLSLGLTKTDLSVIEQGFDDAVERTFRLLDRWRSNLDPFLIRWRNKVDGKQTERVKLETALRDTGLETFLPCIDAYVTRKESDTKDGNPTVNLSLPNGATDADRKQEIDILAVFSAADHDVVNAYHRRLYRVVSHPADSDQSWARIRRIKSTLEPNSRVNNIELLPISFTVDVVSLDDLNGLRRSIRDGSLATALCDVLTRDSDGDGGYCETKGVDLKLELDKTTYNEATRFFKDLNPSMGQIDDQSNLYLPGHDGASRQVPEPEGFDAWMSSAAQKPEVELPDNQQRGVPLVWRNVSQHNFGF